FRAGRLLGRFARGLEPPLLLLTVLSPVFLPSLNLMLDVPALALGLFAVTVFLRACDRASLPLALGAGLLAGIAIQTTYPALLARAVMLLAAVFFRRIPLGILAGMTAALVFVSWEGFVAVRHHEAHFLCQLRHDGRSWRGMVWLPEGLFTISGA